MTLRDIILGIVILAGLFAYFYFRNRLTKPHQAPGTTAPPRFSIDSKQESRLKQALEYLKKHKEITNEEYRKMVKVSDRQAVRDLDVLEQKGYIRQTTKAGKYTKYKLLKH